MREEQAHGAKDPRNAELEKRQQCSPVRPLLVQECMVAELE